MNNQSITFYLGTPNDHMKELLPKMIEELIDILLKKNNRKSKSTQLFFIIDGKIE